MTTSSIYDYLTSAPTIESPIATILGTKNMADNWNDVLLVKIEDKVYAIGDLVFMNTKQGGLGKIVAFEHRHVKIRLVGTETIVRDTYDHISLIGKKEADLDPNTAFKRKKRRMF